MEPGLLLLGSDPTSPIYCRRPMSARDVIADLRELATHTSNADGAQRLALGPGMARRAHLVQRQARARSASRLTSMRPATAGPRCPAQSDRTVIIGSHLDSVPNGGWLDGRARRHGGPRSAAHVQGRSGHRSRSRSSTGQTKKGARFSRSLLGSSAASGSLRVDEVEHLQDKTGVRLVDALRENGVELIAHARVATVSEGHQRQGLSRAAYRTGAGARGR